MGVVSGFITVVFPVFLLIGDAGKPGMNPGGSDEMRVNSRGRKIGAVRM